MRLIAAILLASFVWSPAAAQIAVEKDLELRRALPTCKPGELEAWVSKAGTPYRSPPCAGAPARGENHPSQSATAARPIGAQSAPPTYSDIHITDGPLSDDRPPVTLGEQLREAASAAAQEGRREEFRVVSNPRDGLLEGRAIVEKLKERETAGKMPSDVLGEAAQIAGYRAQFLTTANLNEAIAARRAGGYEQLSRRSGTAVIVTRLRVAGPGYSSGPGGLSKAFGGEITWEGPAREYSTFLVGHGASYMDSFAQAFSSQMLDGDYETVAVTTYAMVDGKLIERSLSPNELESLQSDPRGEALARRYSADLASATESPEVRSAPRYNPAFTKALEGRFYDTPARSSSTSKSQLDRERDQRKQAEEAQRQAGEAARRAEEARERSASAARLAKEASDRAEAAKAEAAKNEAEKAARAKREADAAAAAAEHERAEAERKKKEADDEAAKSRALRLRLGMPVDPDGGPGNNCSVCVSRPDLAATTIEYDLKLGRDFMSEKPTLEIKQHLEDKLRAVERWKE